MVSPLILVRLIHQTWAPWRPTSISHLIISLKSGTYNREISVIKLEGGGGNLIVWGFFIGFFFSLEVQGKSCRCALRRCFFKLFLSQSFLYLQCSSVTFSGPSNNTVTSSDIRVILGELGHNITAQQIAISRIYWICCTDFGQKRKKRTASGAHIVSNRL